MKLSEAVSLAREELKQAPEIVRSPGPLVELIRHNAKEVCRILRLRPSDAALQRLVNVLVRLIAYAEELGDLCKWDILVLSTDGGGVG